MSAKNGSTRSARRIVGICLAMAIALTAVFASAASAAPKPVSKTYVAIGDSLAFGYSAQLYNENEAAGDPATAFEHGYVDDYYNKIKMHSQIDKVNLGCPGETSKSLIGNKALGAALEASFGATTEAPCAYQEAWAAFHKPGAGGPLHVEYAGKSQAEAALEQIAIAALSGRPVTHVTLNIGANDELAQIHSCEKEVGEEFGKEGKSKYGETPEKAVTNCLVAHLEILIKTIITNTSAVGYAIRHGAEFGGVNYSGPITFVASYDPDGAVFEAGKELLPGSTSLAALINGKEAHAFGQKFNPEAEEFGFEACTAEPLAKFNPKNRHEPGDLQKWTNMANFTEFEGKKNGPDIHPTPAGYEEMAKIIKKECP
jgi:lysophospholipase L1-like esterase